MLLNTNFSEPLKIGNKRKVHSYVKLATDLVIAQNIRSAYLSANDRLSET